MTEDEWLEYQKGCEHFKCSPPKCIKRCKLQPTPQECGFVPFIMEYELCEHDECPMLKIDT